MASPYLQRADDCNQSMVSTESAREKSTDSCVPMSGTLSTSSSIDVSFKSSLSSTITGSSSVKSSFSGKVSDGMGADAKIPECKSVDNLKNERLECVESGKSSLSVASYRSSVSDSNESNCSSLSSSLNKPHKGNDPRWDAIQAVKVRDGFFGFESFQAPEARGKWGYWECLLSRVEGNQLFLCNESNG